MRKHLLVGLWIGWLATAATSAEAPKGMTGRVVDENGQALSGVKVVGVEYRGTGQDSDNKEVASTTTGADGAFHLDTPASVVVATKQGKCVDWVFCAVNDKGNLALRLGPAAVIDGEVVDELGKAVGGASVNLLLRIESPLQKEMMYAVNAEPLTTKTDAQGHFQFANVPEGAGIGFDVTAPGFARVLADGGFAPGQKGLRFVLPPEGRLEGALVDKATGKPLAEVTVRAMCGPPSGFHWAFAKTDKDGRFAMHGLPAGKYDVEIVGTGLALPDWIGSQEKVQVENGKTATTKIEALQGGILEVVLTDSATSKPVAAIAHMTVSPAEDLRIRHSGVSTSEGVAKLLLPAGKYVISYLAPFGGYAYKPGDSTSFAVETGKTQRALVGLSAVPQVVLTVQDYTGKAVAGAKAQLLPLLGAPKDLVAGEDGRLAVSADDIGPLFCFLLIRHPQQNLCTLVPLAKNEKPPQVELCPPAEVSGKVIDAQGRPLPGVAVQAQIDASHMGRFAVIATARTDKEGRYQMALPSTMGYAVSAHAPGSAAAETMISEIDLARGKGKLKDLVLNPSDRALRGVVVDAQGKAVTGAIVRAKPMDGLPFPGSAVTDANGQFTLEHLSDAPTIYVSARVPGRGWDGSGKVKPGDKELTIKVSPPHWD